MATGDDSDKPDEKKAASPGDVEISAAPHEHPQGPPEFVLERVEIGVAKVEAAIMTVLVIGLILLAVVHVFAFIKYHLVRNQALETEYFKPLFAQGVFAIGFLGTAIATQENKLFRVDFVVTFLRPRGRLIWRAVGSVFSLGTMIALLYLGKRCIPSLPPDPVHVSPFMRQVLTTYTDWISGVVSQGAPFVTVRETFRLMLGLFVLCSFHFVLRFVVDVGHLVRGTVPRDVLDGAGGDLK